MKIGIVTPNYNQSHFIADCLLSVVSQRGCALEYYVLDGGSTDSSVQIIKSFSDQITHWTSEPDSGPYSVIQNTLNASDADVFGWLNSDDMLLPGALAYVSEVFERFPEVQWLSTLTTGHINGEGDLQAERIVGISRDGWLDGRHLPGHVGQSQHHGFIQQESTFFRRELWQEVGGLRLDYGLAGDFDLWSRFFLVSDIHVTRRMIAAFRSHGSNRSGNMDRYMTEARHSLAEMRQRAGWRGRYLRGRLPSMSRIFGPQRLESRKLPFCYHRQEIMRVSNVKGADLSVERKCYL